MLLPSLPWKMFQRKWTFSILDFLTLKDFQRCPEDVVVFKTFNSVLLLTTFMFFFPQNFLINTKKIIRRTIFIFRRYFRSSSLPAFCKIGVLNKILSKVHMPKCLFNKVEDLSDWSFKLKTKTNILRTPFYSTPPGDCLLIFRKLDIQTFGSKQICSLDQYCRHAIIIWWVET